MTFEIDTDIPPPPKRKRDVYPLDKMEVGHSFAVPANSVQNLREAVSQRKFRGGKGTFTVRKCDEGYRCWRLE